MITVEQDMIGSLILGFKYYPPYIDGVKRLGATFEPSTKKWVLPRNRFNVFRDEFKGQIFFKTPEWEITGEAPPDYSKLYEFETECDIDALGFKPDRQPFTYQRFGIKFLVDRLESVGMAFIADDVGIGKTCQAMGAFKYMQDFDKVKDITIVCKKSIKQQWADEINDFLDVDADIYVVPDNKNKRMKMYEDIKNNPRKTILIINYHLLLKDVDLIKTDMTIYDEVHVAKKYNGEINKACRKLTKKANYCLFMTGTPIMTNPEDMYGIVSIKDQKYFGSFKEFQKEFFTYYNNGRYTNLVGFKNLDILREKIQKIILRRTSGEVAIDLPEIVTVKKVCNMDAKQKGCMEIATEKTQRTEEKIAVLKKRYAELKKNGEDVDGIYAEIAKLEASLKGFIAIEQAIANTPVMFHYSKSMGVKQIYKDVTPSPSYLSDKMVKFLDLAESIRDAGGKVVCFTKYETVAQYCTDLLNRNGINTVIYSGGMSGEDRDNAVHEFKNNDEVTAIIGTDAMAEGLNLQCANNLINIDLPFNVAIYNQRLGRIRRAGSKYSTSFVYNLITKESIDETIWNKVEETENTFDSFVSVDKAQSELLRKLNN